MKTKLYIPQVLKVGFQKRQDTYTGKLSYIIYRDDKKVWRKEKSWDGWCDKKLPLLKLKTFHILDFILTKG